MFLVINVQDFTNANIGYLFGLLHSSIRPGLYLCLGSISPTSSVAFLQKRFYNGCFFTLWTFPNNRLPLPPNLANSCHFFLSKCDRSVIKQLFRNQRGKFLANILGKLTLEHRLQKPVPYRLATPQCFDDLG